MPTSRSQLSCNLNTLAKLMSYCRPAPSILIDSYIYSRVTAALHLVCSYTNQMSGNCYHRNISKQGSYKVMEPKIRDNMPEIRAVRDNMIMIK